MILGFKRVFFADLMLLGVFLHTFRERVERNLRWSRKDDSNPDGVRQVLMGVASRLGAKEVSRHGTTEWKMGQNRGKERRRRQA